MAKTVTLENILSAEEPAFATGANLSGGQGVDEDAVNPGAKTGPYGDGLKNNTIFAPVPRTNLQIELTPGATTTLTVEDLIDVEFYNALIVDVEKHTTLIEGLLCTVE